MKIYILKLKSDLRITIDWVKKNLKKGFEITTFSLVEYNKYAKYSEVKILKVDTLIMSNKVFRVSLDELPELRDELDIL